MQSRYDEADAARAIARWSPGPTAKSSLLALRTYTARLLGADAALVLHGGGNTSVKAQATTILGDTVDVLHVKGSGWDLATIEPAGHPAVRLEPLRRLRALPALSDEAMVNELRQNLLDASAPTPSVETLLHAWLPARFVDHTHADAILALADQPDGEAIFRDLFGAGLVWVPYVMPGFELARRCADAFEAVARRTTPTQIVLERHGLFTFGENARESYERTIDAVTRAESFVAKRRATSRRAAAPAAPATAPDAARDVDFLARLRGAIAAASGAPPERGPILDLRATPAVLAFLARPDARDLSQIGCATPDHVIRTKPTPLFVDDPAATDLASAIAAFAARYDAYFEDACAKKKVTRTKLDPWPRVVLAPGIGLVAIGKTKAEASIAADVYEHTIDVVVDATDVGTYAPVSRGDLFDVEYWSLEQAKIKRETEPPLGRRIALVTGAASGIGRATAARLVELGAHVVVVDRDAAALDEAAAEIGRGRARQVATFAADVTKDDAVRAAVDHAVLRFGGVDLVVSNAGDAPQGQLDTAEGEMLLRASLELNLLAHVHVARAACDVMKKQRFGGCLLFNASKSAFNPGPDFGPYAVAKSALVATMRQYAIDLGKAGIRANAVNADRIRTRLFEGGVVESRAKARGVSVDDYFRANLLGREVRAADVADAFAWLAGAAATTGCIITVDGGNAAAFPR